MSFRPGQYSEIVKLFNDSIDGTRHDILYGRYYERDPEYSSAAYSNK